MAWFAKLPDDLFVRVLNDQLHWRDLARLDSALCVRAFRPTFLSRLATGVQPNKAKDIERYSTMPFVDEYLEWVDLRGVPSVEHLNLSAWRRKLSKPFTERNWGTFNYLLSITSHVSTEEMSAFINSLWRHCPNLQKASFAPYCSVDGSRTGDNIVPCASNNNRKNKNFTLLPLFRACKRLTELNCDILTFSPEEAEEVPRTLESIQLEGWVVAQGDEGPQHVRNIVQMVRRLQSIKMFVLNMDGLQVPPELYVSLCNSSTTLSEVNIYKGTGTIGIDVMLRQCNNLTSLSLRDVFDMSQEVFTMMFELPSLTYLSVGGSSSIPGLLPTYNITTNINNLHIYEFELLKGNGDEVKRILLACPLLKRGCMRGSICTQFMLENRELCMCLEDYHNYIDRSLLVY